MATPRSLVLAVALVLAGGRAHARPPSQIDIAKRAWEHAMQEASAELERCSRIGTARQVYGDVVVDVDRRGRWAVSPSRSLGAHGAELAACVRQAIASRLTGSDMVVDVSRLVMIGAPSSLLPSAAVLLPVWGRALATGPGARAARAALRALVPPDYTLTRELCFTTTRESSRWAEYLWLPSVGPRVPELWRAQIRQSLGDDVSTVVWVTTGGFVTQGRRGLCFVRFGPDRQAALRAGFDAVGSGWVGDFTEVLLRPRVELPRDQTYISLSTRGGRVCAVTTAGAVWCIGPADPPLPPPPAPVVGIALGLRFACGLDRQGSIYCWGDIAAPPSGPFRLIRAGDKHVCGVRTDGQIACWGDGGMAVARVPSGADFVDVATAWGSCGLRRDGTLTCWGSSDHDWQPPGRFLTIAIGSSQACAVRRDHTVGCWRRDGDPIDTPTPERFTDVVTGAVYPRCGRRDDRTVVCWRAWPAVHDTPPPTGKLGQLAADQDTFCGIRDDGGVTCWGDPWPGHLLADSTWPEAL